MAKKKQTFEESMEKLEQIIEQLESGDLSLEEAFKCYQEGMGLSFFCSEELKRVEKEVLQIQRKHDGTFNESSFQIKGEE